jgi:hypothetical protein
VDTAVDMFLTYIQAAGQATTRRTGERDAIMTLAAWFPATGAQVYRCGVVSEASKSRT